MVKNIRMKDIPQEDRPRERLARDGASALSNQELLAILLHSGTKNESVMQLAERLLCRFEGLELLKDASIEELKQVKGIGAAKAIQLLAGFELGQRMARKARESRYSIRSPEDGADYVMEEMRALKQEHFLVVLCI